MTIAVASSVLAALPMGSPASAQGSLETSLDYTVDPGAYNNSVQVATVSTMTYPRLAIDRDPASPRYGTIYVVGLRILGDSACGNLTVIRSFDGGRSFDEPHVSPLCMGGGTVDVVVGRNGTLFAAAWGPRFLRSTDGGLSWTQLGLGGTAYSAPSLALDLETDMLYMAWSSEPQWSFGPVYATFSRDGGETWTGTATVLPNGMAGLSPQISAHGHSSVIGFIASNGSDPFIAAVGSLDGGQTWGNVSALTAPTPCLRDSAPSATVSRSGVFAISWYQDPTLTTDCWHDWGNSTQTFVSLSFDGGRSFSSPRPAGGPPGWPTGGFGDAFVFDDADRMYATWHSIGYNWSSASVYVSNSTGPGGEFESASFATRLQVSGGNATAQENLALGLNNTVYLLWVAFDPFGLPNRTGIFVRAVAGEAEGDLVLSSSTSASLSVEVRDASTGAIAYRAPWTGSPLVLTNVPPASYEVQVNVGNQSSVAGQMPVRTWGRTTFTVRVSGISSGPPPGPGPLPWEIAAGAAVAVAVSAAAFAAVQHTRLTRASVLQREVRALMYRFIRENPGSSFSEVRDAIGLHNGVAAYHLGVLEKQGLVRSKSRRRHRWYYPEGTPTQWQDLPLSPLQVSLLEEIRKRPGIGVRELARTVDRGASSVAYNVKALSREGVLRTEHAGRKLRCFPADESNVS